VKAGYLDTGRPALARSHSTSDVACTRCSRTLEAQYQRTTPVRTVVYDQLGAAVLSSPRTVCPQADRRDQLAHPPQCRRSIARESRADHEERRVMPEASPTDHRRSRHASVRRGLGCTRGKRSRSRRAEPNRRRSATCTRLTSDDRRWGAPWTALVPRALSAQIGPSGVLIRQGRSPCLVWEPPAARRARPPRSRSGGPGLGQISMAIFPRACPDSRYRMASAASASG
jgi:hypothetical protein